LLRITVIYRERQSLAYKTPQKNANVSLFVEFGLDRVAETYPIELVAVGLYKSTIQINAAREVMMSYQLGSVL